MNPKPIVLRDRALLDFAQVVRYYSSDVSPSVARSFVAALQEGFQHLSQFPASGSTRYALESNLPELRSWPVRGFPYLVLYADSELSVDIYRVLHTSRDIPAGLSEGMED